MDFKVVNSETIYRGPVFNLRQDRLALPNGKVARLDIIDHRDAVTLIPLDAEGQIWFIEQYRHATQKILLELPAGVAEPGEAPEISAQREIREETGMAAGEIRRLGSFYLAPGYSTEYMHIFLASGLYPAPLPMDEDEILQVKKLTARQAYHLAENGQIQDAKSLVALFWVRPHLVKMGLID